MIYQCPECHTFWTYSHSLKGVTKAPLQPCPITCDWVNLEG